MWTIRGWCSAGSQSRPRIHTFGLRTIREQLVNHSVCSCIRGFKETHVATIRLISLHLLQTFETFFFSHSVIYYIHFSSNKFEIFFQNWISYAAFVWWKFPEICGAVTGMVKIAVSPPPPKTPQFSIYILFC